MFVDTCIFDEANYHVDRGSFAQLVTLCAEGVCELLLTDITLAEVDRHLREKTSQARSALEQFQSKARILRNLNDHATGAMFEPLDEDKIVTELRGRIQAFGTTAHAEVLRASDLPATSVMSKYFDETPPFGAGRKKSEFPDAFVIEALLDWCARHSERVYVVTTDGDMRLACSGEGPLIHLESLPAFVEVVLADDDLRVELARGQLDHHRLSVEKAIGDAFEDLGFFILDGDSDSEVDAVRVHDIDISSLSVIRVSEGGALYEGPVEITLSADVRYGDPEFYIYDSEEKEGAYFEHIEETIEYSDEIPVELEVCFSLGDFTEWTIEALVLNRGEDYALRW